MFVLTPYNASFNEARFMCLAMGADIVQEALDYYSDIKYHRFEYYNY